MHIRWLQHVPFEGLGVIDSWATDKGHRLSRTSLWAEETLPDSLDFDLLVVMGGPMGVHDEATHAWLAAEKSFLRAAVAADKAMLGICLGAQLIASVLGACVSANQQKEIGWFPVNRVMDLSDRQALRLPDRLLAFHWHGDTFAIPEGARRLFSSAACPNQGFLYNNRIIGLQFHPEITIEGIAILAEHCRDELTEGAWIQTEQRMTAERSVAAGAAHLMMYDILAYLETQVGAADAQGERAPPTARVLNGPVYSSMIESNKSRSASIFARLPMIAR